MKHLQFLLILSLLFVCDSLLAQKKNYPGYYITQQGDTVKGTFPMYTQWNKNPLQVTFKVDGKTDQIELTPQNARAFVVEGNDEYISHTGLRLLNPIEDAWLYGEQVFINSNDSTEQVSIFLRLAKRTVNIEFYVLDDTKRQNFFYKLPGQPIIELLYKKNFVQGKIKEVAAYKQQLNNLFADIIAKRNLKSSLEKLPYDEEEISSFLGKLFPSANHELMPKVSKTEWVVSAGLALNMVNIDPGKLDELVPNSYSSSFSPVASARIIIPLGRNFGKYFFSPQIKVFRYKSTGEITDGNLIKIATYKADLAAIAQLSGGVNIINQGPNRVFIMAGMGMFKQFGGKYIKDLYTAPNRSPYIPTVESKLLNITYSLDLAAGVELKKKFLLSATYIAPTTISKFMYFSPRLSSVQLQIGYKL